MLETRDSSYAEAHLLLAQVQLHQGNFMNAQQSLEVGLSYNFEVREHPIYHLINAKVLKEQGYRSYCYIAKSYGIGARSEAKI